MTSKVNWTKILVYSTALQFNKVQSSIEKFHWSKKLRKTEKFSFNWNIRVPLQRVNLFLHVFLCLKGRLNTDTSPQNFRTTFLDTDLTKKFKKSAVASAIAIPLPLCFSCFVPSRRFWENLTKPFYFYVSRTWESPGGTPSVISLALRG